VSGFSDFRQEEEDGQIAALPSSCLALCRASTPYDRSTKDVDGRDKPGHDAAAR
jgi:hypothetical protein